MKYTFMGFNQQRIIDLDLDAKDAVILRYIIDFKDTKKMKCEVIDGEAYYWIKYDGIAQEYPLLGLKNADSVYKRLKKLVKVGILKHKTIKSNGTYSYYAIGDNYLTLISTSTEADVNTEESKKVTAYETPEKTNNQSDENPTPIGNISGGGTDENQEGYGWKSGTNNPSTKYPSTINNPNIKKAHAEIIEFLNLKANTKYKLGIDRTVKKIEARINEGFTIDDFKKVIEIKCQEWLGTDQAKYLRPETLFGGKFEGYLNQAIAMQPKRNKSITKPVKYKINFGEEM